MRRYVELAIVAALGGVVGSWGVLAAQDDPPVVASAIYGETLDVTGESTLGTLAVTGTATVDVRQADVHAPARGAFRRFRRALAAPCLHRSEQYLGADPRCVGVWNCRPQGAYWQVAVRVTVGRRS